MEPLTIRYANVNQTDLHLDLFPAKGRCKSTLIYAHGGGFSHGGRHDKTALKLYELLENEGVSVASIDYRKSTPIEAFPDNQRDEILHAQARTEKVGLRINPNYCGSRFYAALEDFSSALKCLKTHADHLSLSGPFIALGASAGGIIATSLAYPPRLYWEELEKPDAAMSICGAMVQPWRLKPDGPPLAMMHGFHDGVISPHNIKLLAHKAKIKSVDVETYITQIKGHRHQVDAFLYKKDENGSPYLNILRNLIKKVK